mmetsp:Transcript_29915/g.58695  ORF Transcript_29915/g.58695 Transcript_29915/m.58695 type:complete len:91 (-) Transcript_29915:1121-1393(-)
MFVLFAFLSVSSRGLSPFIHRCTFPLLVFPSTFSLLCVFLREKRSSVVAQPLGAQLEQCTLGDQTGRRPGRQRRKIEIDHSSPSFITASA